MKLAHRVQSARLLLSEEYLNVDYLRYMAGFVSLKLMTLKEVIQLYLRHKWCYSHPHFLLSSETLCFFLFRGRRNCTKCLDYCG